MAATQSNYVSEVDGIEYETDPGRSQTVALKFTRSVDFPFAAKTSSYTLTAADRIVTGNAAGGMTLTLPTAVGCAGRTYELMNVGASGTVTIATTSSQTINGAAASGQNLTTQYSFLRVISDGANWLKF